MVPANTDFFDSLNLDGVTVERAWVDIGDDCFSPKANTTNIYVNNIYCNGRYDVLPPLTPADTGMLLRYSRPVHGISRSIFRRAGHH